MCMYVYIYTLWCKLLFGARMEGMALERDD